MQAESIVNSFPGYVAKRGISLGLIEVIRDRNGSDLHMKIFEFPLFILDRYIKGRMNNERFAKSFRETMQFVAEFMLDSPKEAKIANLIWSMSPVNDWGVSEEALLDWCFEVVEIYLEDVGYDFSRFYLDSFNHAERLSR